VAIDLLVTDRNLNVLGDPVDGWMDLACDLNYKTPAAGSVAIPARPEYAALLQPGNRIVVIRDGAIWCAGPMEQPQQFEWAADGEQDPGKVTVAFTDDLARIAGYLTYPDPTVDLASQTVVSDPTYQLTTTNAETIIRTLVNLNCGPGAITARRIEQLVLDTAAGVGTNTSISTRFEPLLDVCRTVASGDGLGFRTYQDGDQVKFGVYSPADRTTTARFSRNLGNLRSASFTLAAPTATSELVMGGDTGTRQFVEVTSGAATDWYRVEKLLDQSGTTDVNGELTQAGNLELGNDNPQVSLSTVTVDTEDLRAGRDFGLGDKVTVELASGFEVADLVYTIRLEATPGGGELVTSVIGKGDQTTDTRTVQQIRGLARRLGRIETRR